MEELLETLCPSCAAAVRNVLSAVKSAAEKEAVARHEANKLAAQQRVEADGEAEQVLKGKK